MADRDPLIRVENLVKHFPLPGGWLTGQRRVVQALEDVSIDIQRGEVLSQSNAIMNQCYFIDINGVGPWGGGKSMIIDPDGRVLQQAQTNETILTEIIDLDNVTRSREFGTLGLAQTLKQMRDSTVTFPQYQGAFSEGDLYRKLGGVSLIDSLTNDGTTRT